MSKQAAEQSQTITKCGDRSCPSHKECWRYVVPPLSDNQGYALFHREEDEDKCESFEPVKKTKNNNINNVHL